MMKKIIIKPGCITCGTCAFIAPTVFEVTDISHIKTGADLEKNKEQIEKAIASCPMQVIAYEKK